MRKQRVGLSPLSSATGQRVTVAYVLNLGLPVIVLRIRGVATTKLVFCFISPLFDQHPTLNLRLENNEAELNKKTLYSTAVVSF